MEQMKSTSSRFSAGADYINQGRLAGASDAQIELELMKAGWQTTDIKQAFQLANSNLASQVHVRSTNSKVWLWWLFAIIAIAGLGVAAAVITYYIV